MTAEITEGTVSKAADIAAAPFQPKGWLEVMQALVQGEPAVPKAWLWQFSDGDWHEVPFATKDGCEHECAGYSGKAHPLFLPTPPAQTPPRLTDEMLRDCLRECPTDAIEPMRTRWLHAKDFARAIESAVRKQAGWPE